jgi:hypothetical protein
MLAMSATATAEIWDVTKDFSVGNGNPNGAWSYGWVNNSQFQLDQVGETNSNGPIWYSQGETLPIVWLNTTAGAVNNVAPGQLSLHPGPSNASVVRWTAPAGISPSVQVQGQFYEGDTGAMTVGIFIDGIPTVTTPYWDQLKPFSEEGGVASFDFSLPVSAGDTIDFAVYNGYISGNTPLEVTISTVPEPGTLAIWAPALLALVAIHLRRRWAKA